MKTDPEVVAQGMASYSFLSGMERVTKLVFWQSFISGMVCLMAVSFGAPAGWLLLGYVLVMTILSHWQHLVVSREQHASFERWQEIGKQIANEDAQMDQE